MKKGFAPYYISRAILSAAFSILVAGLSWKAALLAAAFFGLFVLYLHSGWFSIDPANPLFPLRRDTHGQLVQRKALIAAVVLGLLLYIASAQLSSYGGMPFISGDTALSIGIVTYFLVQFALFIKSQLLGSA